MSNDGSKTRYWALTILLPVSYLLFMSLIVPETTISSTDGTSITESLFDEPVVKIICIINFLITAFAVSTLLKILGKKNIEYPRNSVSIPNNENLRFAVVVSFFGIISFVIGGYSFTEPAYFVEGVQTTKQVYDYHARKHFEETSMINPDFDLKNGMIWAALCMVALVLFKKYSVKKTHNKEYPDSSAGPA